MGRARCCGRMPGFEAGDKRPSSSGIPLLFPFPGRIGGATFQFEGRDYRLEPGDAFGNAIHGFVFDRPWRVIEHEERPCRRRVSGVGRRRVDSRALAGRFSHSRFVRSPRPRARQRHPVREHGHAPLPCGFGTHAYFRLPLVEGSASCRYGRHSSRASILGTRANDSDRSGLRRFRTNTRWPAVCALHDHQFDTVFTDLRPDADGLIRTRLRDPSSGRTLTQTFDTSFTQCVVYTPPHREAICIEPYTCVPRRHSAWPPKVTERACKSSTPANRGARQFVSPYCSWPLRGRIGGAEKKPGSQTPATSSDARRQVRQIPGYNAIYSFFSPPSFASFAGSFLSSARSPPGHLPACSRSMNVSLFSFFGSTCIASTFLKAASIFLVSF